jgi:glycosyltransferase involved in cell wall biosynthesis
MDKVKISIVVPVYNAEEYLDRCLHSVLDQEFTSYEVILVDDGSTDASWLICDRYSSTDPRFITLHQPNKGVSAARNAGINMAQGEYVMFLDADDALLPDALESMVTSASGEDVVIGGYGVFINNVPSSEVMPADTVSYKGHDYARFFEDNLLPYCELLDAPWAKLFRTKAIRRIRFNEDMDYAEDKLFVFEVLSKCTSILTVSKAVYGYYKRPGSLGSDISSDQHIRKLQIFLQRYVPLISVLCERCPSVATVQYLYHNDVVSRYLCRILNIFATRDSEMLNEETLSWVYSMMDADKNLGGVFSLRIGQVPNMYLYRKRNISKSIKRYKFFQKITRLFHKNK